MSVGDVPNDVIIGSFLAEMHRRGFVTTVVATETRAIGRHANTVISSNGGHGGVNAARHTLLHLGQEAAMIERTAKALHSFRFVEAGQTAPAPVMDVCVFGGCLSTMFYEEPGAEPIPCGKLSWDKLPPELQEGHRLLVKSVIIEAMREPVQKQSTVLSI